MNNSASSAIEDSSMATPCRAMPAHPKVHPFAGTLGGNQRVVVDRSDPDNESLLEKLPDAAPLMTVQEGLSLQGFFNVDLWRLGLLECVGAMLLDFVTVWMSIRSSAAIVSPNGEAGVFSTSTFLGPLFGAFSNWIFLTLFIFSFSNVSGSHLNPTITLGTFFARLISLPRMVIYILGQTLGGALSGFILRSAYGTRDFTVGGCYIDTNIVPLDEAFLLEFTFCLLLIFLSFGVGLDPRQSQVCGPALSPFLVGLVLFGVSWGSAYTRAGYSGASVNPARCFGVYVATTFPSYHWIHWVGPLAASIGHGIIYFVVPPWKA
ncbi:hypothetical protein N7490_005007 [Penicillium lividum]|nr:hypothetical protein N7490_005007 [Penicillium lividum]